MLSFSRQEAHMARVSEVLGFCAGVLLMVGMLVAASIATQAHPEPEPAYLVD